MDVAAAVDHLIRRGDVKGSDRSEAMAEFPQKFGRPVLDIRAGGVVQITGLKQGARTGRWTRSGSRLTIHSGSSTQAYRIERDVLIAESSALPLRYRRA